MPLAERLAAQLLSGPPADSVVSVVDRLLAVQAQDARGMRLSIRSRSTGLHSSDLDRTLTDDRSVVVSTLNRGTLHLVRAEDYWWLHPLTTPQLATGNLRRLVQEGVSADAAERGVAAIVDALASNGPMTRAALREIVARAGVPVEGQALVHILLRATIAGLVIRGPMLANEQAFVRVSDWLGRPPREVSRDAALGELAHRYLAGHGPASAADLAKWAGINIGDARRGLASAGRKVTTRSDGLADLTDRDATPRLPPPRLLGPFDPSLLGWVSREQIVGTHTGIVTNNGLFRAFAMVRGKAVATWSLQKDRLTLLPFEPIPASAEKALDAEASAVVDFLSN